MKKRKFFTYFVIFITILVVAAGCGKNAGTPLPTTPPQVEEEAPENPAPSTPTAPVAESSNPQPTAPTAKSWSWWFTRNAQHQTPAINQETAKLIAENNAFYVIPNNSKKIYLTFDAGYELGYTGKILDTLDRQHVKAAFFITGQYIKTQPDLVKRMHSSGNLVCNHTWNHPDLSTVSQQTFNQELESLDQKYTELTGVPLDHYLRPPMGNYSENSLKWANALGYKTVFWSIAFMDWDPAKQPGADFSYKHVTDNIHPGAVILLHAISQSDTEALDRIITDLKAQGYVFSTFGN